MSTNAYEEMLEYLDGQRKKLAGMRERLDEPGVEKQYEACLKAYRDLKNSLDWAKEKGFAEGYVETRLNILMLGYGKTREEALVKIAKELLEKNVSTQAIYMTTGISVEDISEKPIDKKETQATKYELPEHLKKMRGILAGVKDENDDRLNYLLEKDTEYSQD